MSGVFVLGILKSLVFCVGYLPSSIVCMLGIFKGVVFVLVMIHQSYDDSLLVSLNCHFCNLIGSHHIVLISKLRLWVRGS
jgi:hypothetical protein